MQHIKNYLLPLCIKIKVKIIFHVYINLTVRSKKDDEEIFACFEAKGNNDNREEIGRGWGTEEG